MSSETLLRTEDVLLRVMELAPGAATTWHFHTEITDHVVGMNGDVWLELQAPEESLALGPGALARVPPNRPHRVINRGSTHARYLLAQGVGRHDFNEVAAPP